MEHNEGPCREALWPFLCTSEIFQLRVTVEEFNDAKKYGPRAELFFLLRQMPCEADPIEPGHVSAESPISTSLVAEQKTARERIDREQYGLP